MSLRIIKMYIQHTPKYFKDHLRRQLKTRFFYADQSLKEFSTTPLFHGLIKISKETGVIIVWNFTAPQHGKWFA